MSKFSKVLFVIGFVLMILGTLCCESEDLKWFAIGVSSGAALIAVSGLINFFKTPREKNDSE